VIAGCNAALERSGLKSQIQSNTRIKLLLGDLYLGVDTDCSTAIEALSFGQSIDGLNLSPQVKYKLRTGHPIEACRAVTDALEGVHTGLQQIESLTSTLTQFGKFELDTWTGAAADEDLELFAGALHGAVQKAVQDKDLLIPWSLYLTRRKEATELTLTEFVDLLEKKRIKPDELVDAYAYCTYSTITREAFRNIPELGRFTGLKHNQIRDEFKRLDKEIISLRGKQLDLNQLGQQLLRMVRMEQRSTIELKWCY